MNLYFNSFTDFHITHFPDFFFCSFQVNSTLFFFLFFLLFRMNNDRCEGKKTRNSTWSIFPLVIDWFSGTNFHKYIFLTIFKKINFVSNTFKKNFFLERCGALGRFVSLTPFTGLNGFMFKHQLGGDLLARRIPNILGRVNVFLEKEKGCLR